MTTLVRMIDRRLSLTTLVLVVALTSGATVAAELSGKVVREVFRVVGGYHLLMGHRFFPSLIPNALHGRARCARRASRSTLGSAPERADSGGGSGQVRPPGLARRIAYFPLAANIRPPTRSRPTTPPQNFSLLICPAIADSWA